MADAPQTSTGMPFSDLMGVEIENSLEAAIAVALPPTSLMRARTIGQIASLIAGHVGGTAPPTAAPAAAPITVAEPAPSTVEVDLDALSNEQIDQLLGKTKAKGLTLVPLKLYITARGKAKIELGLGKGKQLYDRRPFIVSRGVVTFRRAQTSKLTAFYPNGKECDKVPYLGYSIALDGTDRVREH